MTNLTECAAEEYRVRNELWGKISVLISRDVCFPEGTSVKGLKSMSDFEFIQYCIELNDNGIFWENIPEDIKYVKNEAHKIVRDHLLTRF
jgi:hypothetical protein